MNFNTKMDNEHLIKLILIDRSDFLPVKKVLDKYGISYSKYLYMMRETGILKSRENLQKYYETIKPKILVDRSNKIDIKTICKKYHVHPITVNKICCIKKTNLSEIPGFYPFVYGLYKNDDISDLEKCRQISEKFNIKMYPKKLKAYINHKM